MTTASPPTNSSRRLRAINSGYSVSLSVPRQSSPDMHRGLGAAPFCCARRNGEHLLDQRLHPCVEGVLQFAKPVVLNASRQRPDGVGALFRRHNAPPHSLWLTFLSARRTGS